MNASQLSEKIYSNSWMDALILASAYKLLAYGYYSRSNIPVL